MRAWQICPKWDMAFGAAAKCGSTMLARLVETNGARRLNVPDARQGRECWSVVPKSYRSVFLVRDPVARFASLYANIQQRKREPMNFYKQFEGLSPWDCFDKLLQASPDLMYDVHFQPQYLSVGILRPEYVRLEDFEAWWPLHGPAGAIGPKKANASAKTVAIDDKTAERVREQYKQDQSLWERSWASSINSSARTPIL